MAKVILGATVSLDGYINDRGGRVAALYPDLEGWRDTDRLERLKVMELLSGRRHMEFRIVKVGS